MVLIYSPPSRLIHYLPAMNQKASHQFCPPTEIARIEAFGSGHINHSYRIYRKEGIGPDYLLQRINHHIFTDVPALMQNIKLVTDHLREKIRTADDEGKEQLTLRIAPTLSGANFYQDDNGDYWRAYEFMGGLTGYDLVSTPEQAYAGARSYGYFLRFLNDFPPDQVSPLLPDFHNVVHRLTAFRRQVSLCTGERSLECAADIKAVLALAEEMCQIQWAWEVGKLPTRVTHNDTKFNNVLLTKSGEGKAVVDLDTVMPGVVHFDFGDGIRTGASTATEDEVDASLVGVDLAKFQGFTAGYLGITRDYLRPLELELLPHSGGLLAYLMGVRFLTDYLAGDVYYKIKYPDHNLVRARNQLRLVRELRQRLPDLRTVIRKA